MRQLLLILVGCHIGAGTLRASQADPAGGLRPPAAGPVQPALSSQHHEWIMRHPVVRVGLDPAWPPFSTFPATAEQPAGIDPDLLARLGKQLGVTFEIVRTTSWAETWEKFVRGEIDMTTGTALSPSREEKALFTGPYLDFPVAIITRRDAPFLVGMDQIAAHTLALPHEHITALYMKEHHPGTRLLLADTMGEALRAVSTKQADATLDNLASASYLIRELRLHNLKIGGITDFKFELRFAVRKDWPELVDILNAGLLNLDEADRQQVISAWIAPTLDTRMDWTPFLIIAGVTALFLGFTLFWNRRLANELSIRQAAEAALREREADLARANAKLQVMNDEKDMIIKMAAHDLNNPLTTIMLLCEDSGLNEPLRTAEIRTCCDRMNRLIHNLLNVEAREASGHERRGHLARVSAPVILDRVVARYRRSAHQKDIALRMEYQPASAGIILVDEDALDQVYDNLISNAVKYTRTGGIVTVQIIATEGWQQTVVEDQGPGIPAEEFPLLFNKFSKLSPRPTGGEPSFGLGLAIVKRLVEKMQGRIRCESTPGLGSRFIVEFPLAGN